MGKYTHIKGIPIKKYYRLYWHKRRKRLIKFLGGKCVRCGTTENLEIDHIDPSKKEIEAGDCVNSNFKRVRGEIKKCQLLCEKHHIEKTVSEKPPWQHGTMHAFMHKKCKCVLCEGAKRKWYNKRNKKRRKQYGALSRGPRGPYGRSSSHGDYLHYTRGCRCKLCRQANTNRVRENKIFNLTKKFAKETLNK